MNDEIISALESEWEKPDGFLGSLRLGNFHREHFERFISLLNTINFEGQSQLCRKLVSLLWYIPIFMSWQRERVKKQAGSLSEFDVACNRVQECIERILGVP